MSLSGRLESCYTGAVHDVLWATGLERFTLPPEIRPLNPENRLCGPVWQAQPRLAALDVGAERQPVAEATHIVTGALDSPASVAQSPAQTNSSS